MLEYTLGASDDCDLVYKFDTVSSTHLRLLVHAEDEIEIIDNHSKSGTFISDLRIKSAFIRPEDRIEVGEISILGSEIYSKLKLIRNKNRTNFISEFSQLEPLFTVYTEKEQEIKKRPKAQQMKIRLGTSLLLVAILVVLSRFIGESTMYILVIGSAALTAASFYLFKEPDVKEPLSRLKAEYESKLACPKCDRSLSGYTYTYWVSKRKCDRCGAIWA